MRFVQTQHFLNLLCFPKLFCLENLSLMLLNNKPLFTLFMLLLFPVLQTFLINPFNQGSILLFF
ncbi:hypothetical protein MtrunA17_Chr7g0251971 [Medicago truncatula]|uniref:Transmembrane protein n=1 Tax=Medicago truncatula TaxID=3880 RepID=Q2HUK4_MEDTR|nr:hypothetical protein MtrDRAFT_AC149131g35v2 [Medicago truncatula]RHN47343.1 hypothetical protein MtrunA17_Chr7g0251971 [Medicago truncatula]